ncbi:hypothetical protein LTR56_025727 [Elasticomyces elasticus]|nr:hypothetical protein LTR22_028087 [Elasticomyces elasticus]KAK3616766.1 hypothetical protein LTR56_025727 [Elasticomyces elasticus]KAK4893438.1 hypothetical protein LTR49_028487 [Elasticomyces elasticus]KAK5749142.1 hypothetical protein LTS12_020764 [Elasticomyces elasticus]
MGFASNSHIVNKYNLFVVFFVALGTLSTAYGLAVIGSTVGQPSFYTYFNLATADEPGYAHTSNMIGALNGVNSAGAILGCLTSAWFADAYGRKRTIQLGCFILVIGGALCSGSISIGMFLAGRVIAGLGAGILAVCVPMYQGEISTAETRGAMMCVTGIMYAFGYSLAGWMGYACFFFPVDSPSATFAWRFPLALQCAPPLIVLAGSKFIPFSPRWLLGQDRREEAFVIVQRLHATPDDPEHNAAKQEFYLMEKQFELDKTLQPRFLEIFRTKANRRRSLVASILMFGDQFLGIFVMTNYGVLIYASLGLSGSTPLLLNACWTTFTIIGNTWTAFYVDKFGRRTFMLIGACGCVTAVTFLCALTASFLGTTNQAGLNAAVFFIWFYIFWWCFFVDATQYVYVSEIWPNRLRSQGTALGLSMFYLASEVTLVAAPPALNAIGWKFYLVLICPSVVYVGLIYFLFPETKGRTLEEIGTLFGDEHVASHWYGISDVEKEEIMQNALKMTKSGRILDDPSFSNAGEKGDGEMLEETARV